jgi:Tol biopolymer transport system component
MNTIARITSLLGLIALAQACGSDKGLAGPGAAKRLAADATEADQAAYGPWSAPVNLGPVVNSSYNDNHPAISRDGLSLYITSGRPGGVNGANVPQFEEIWVSQRASRDADWAPPVNLGPAINIIGSNTGSPTFTPDGHRMYFHSNRPGFCGLADLYGARRHDKRDDFGWEPAENLGCVVNGPANDNGPTYFEDETTGITTLYFTSTRLGGPGDYDIYASTRGGDEGEFRPAVLVPELSSPFRDTRTAIRRDGLEMFLSSGRPGDDVVGHSAGSEDLWVSTRATTSDVWSPPLNLNLVNQRLGGPAINGPAFDGAPALSFDGTTLFFFSDRPGGFGKRDLYMTTRALLRGPDVVASAQRKAPAEP